MTRETAQPASAGTPPTSWRASVERRSADIVGEYRDPDVAESCEQLA